MSSLTDYYKDMIKKIKKLIENKNYDDAIFLLEDELEAPYVPIEFQTELEELLLTVNAEKNYFSGLNKVENLNRSQLLKEIVDENKINSSALQLFFERYQNNLTQEELSYFEDIFIDRKINNEEKTMLFEMISYFQVESSFRYFNVNIKEEFNITPNKTLIFEQILLFKDTQKIIENLSSKEPSLQNFCLNILLLIYKYYFPLIPDFESKELAKSIFNYMLATLQGEKVTVDNITKLIEKIISNE